MDNGGRKCLKPERIYASCLTPGVKNSVWDCGRIVEDIHLDCPNISSTCLSLGNNGEIFNQNKVFYFLFFRSLVGEGFFYLFFFKVWLVKVNTPLSLSLSFIGCLKKVAASILEDYVARPDFWT